MARVCELWDSAPLARFASMDPADITFGFLRFWQNGAGVRGPANAAAVAWMTGGVTFFAIAPVGCIVLLSAALASYCSTVSFCMVLVTVLLTLVAVAVGVSIWFQDPGVAPRHMLAAAGNSQLVTKLNQIMPRVIHMKLKSDSVRALGLSHSYTQLRWCDVCLLYKPAGVSHASSISSCVYGFDHFCGVLGQVVGRNNRKRFVWLLLVGGAASLFASLASASVLLDMWGHAQATGEPWGSWVTSWAMRVGAYMVLASMLLLVAVRFIAVGSGLPAALSSALWFAAQSGCVVAATAWLPLPMTAAPFIMFVVAFFVGACALLSFGGYHVYLIGSGSTTKDAMKAAHTGRTIAQKRDETEHEHPTDTNPTSSDIPASEAGDSAALSERRGHVQQRQGGTQHDGASAMAPAFPVSAPPGHVNASEDAPLLPGASPALPGGISEEERRAAAAAALGLPPSHALVSDATAAAMASAAAGESPSRFSRRVPRPAAQSLYEQAALGWAAAKRVLVFLTTKEEHRCIDWTCTVPMQVLNEFADAVLQQLEGMSPDNMARHMLRSDGSWAGLNHGTPVANAAESDTLLKNKRIAELSQRLVDAGVWGLRVNSLFLPPFVMGQVQRASAQTSP